MVDQKKAIQCDRKSGFVTTNPRQDSNSGPPSTKPAHLNHYTKELLVGARATCMFIPRTSRLKKACTMCCGLKRYIYLTNCAKTVLSSALVCHCLLLHTFSALNDGEQSFRRSLVAHSSIIGIMHFEMRQLQNREVSKKVKYLYAFIELLKTAIFCQ